MKKSVITLLIFLIMIISVSAVSAADDASDLGASDDATISVANTDTAVAADKDVKNFTELDSSIAGASGELTLSSDYKYNGIGDVETITFSDNIVIDGNGSTIDANNNAHAIFEIISGKTVTLKNMVLKNISGNNALINNYGTLTVDNVTFINAVDGIYSEGSLTVKNSIFEEMNDPAIYADDGEVYLSNNRIISGAGLSDQIIRLVDANLTSTAIVNVEANNSADWKKIVFTARLVDDNNNKISIYDPNDIIVKINDSIIDTWQGTTTDYTALEGYYNAESYGEHIVNITIDRLANPSTDIPTVTVAPKNIDPTIVFTYSPNAPVWNDTVILTVTINNYTEQPFGDLTPTGTVNLTINSGTPISLDLVNGTANYTIANIDVGEYSVRIDYSGDYSFNYKYQQEENIVVAKKAPEITMEVDNSTVDVQFITIILPTDASGTVTVEIDNQVVKSNEELTDGKYTFKTNYPAQDAAHKVKVSFKPENYDGHYTDSVNDTLEFYATLLPTNITITVENKTYGQEVSFSIKLANDIANATVIVRKDGASEDLRNEIVNLTSGYASIPLDVIAAGEYTITVNFEGSNKYAANSNSTKFKVKADEPIITITPTDYVLFEDFNVTVTVSNTKEGQILLTVTDGTVITTNPADLENGTAEFTIQKISVGEHTITAKFINGGENYTDGEKNITINVAKLTPEITVNVGEVCIGESAEVVVNLTNYGTSNAPTGSIIVRIGGSPVNTTDLNNGEAKVVIAYDPNLMELGEYTIEVYYVPTADVNYNSANTQYKFNVTKWDVEYVIDVSNVTVEDDYVVIEITAGNGADAFAYDDNFTVTIKNAKGEVVNETSIELVSGVMKQLKYNATELGEGVYTAEVSYAGDNYHNKNSTKSVFRVRDVIENLTIVVEAVDYPTPAVAYVNASADGDYIVYIENIDRNYTVTVENGIGNVTLDLLPPSNYKVFVKSNMDEYEVKDNYTTFTVNSGTIVGKLTIENVIYLENVTAVITDASIDGNYSIMDGTTRVANVTVVNGTGRKSFAIDKDVGKYTFVLYAPVNANYTNSNDYVNETSFNVTNATIVFSINVENVKYPNRAVVVVTSNVDDNNLYKVFVNDIDTGLYVKVENGTGNVTLSDDKVQYIPGTFNVTVNITKPNYNPASNKTTFDVNKGDLIFNVTVGEFTYGAMVQAIVNAEVTAKNATQGLGYEVYLDNNDTKLDSTAGNVLFDVGKLAAGQHVLKVVANASDAAFEYYNVDHTTYNYTIFVVKTAAINLQVDAPDNPVAYPGPANIVIQSNVAGNYTLTVGTSFNQVVVLEADTPRTIPVYGLDASINAYTATVKSTDTNYTPTTATDDFYMTYGTIQASLTFDIDQNNIPFGTKPVAIITSTNANGTFNITINGKEYTVDVVNGTGNVTIDGVLYANTDYKVEWGAKIANYYQYTGDLQNLHIIPAPVNLTIEFTTVEYPNHVVANVSANATGVYSFTVEGEVYNVTIQTTAGEMKSKTIELGLLGAGAHTTTVTKVDSDKNFTLADVQAEFTVKQGTPTILIEVSKQSYTVLENVSIKITVPLGTGTVNITDSLNKEYNRTNVQLNENGTVTYNISAVKGIGTHTIYVELTDKNFTTALNQTKFEVNKITIGFNISDNKAVYEQEVIIDVNLTDLVDGASLDDAQLIITGYPAHSAVAVDSFNLGKLAGGKHTLNITFTGNENYYAGHSELYEFNVERFVPTVNATAIGAIYPNNATVKFNSSRDGNFQIFVIDADDVVVQIIPVLNVTKDTEILVEIENLTAGEYKAKVTYVANENYTSVDNITEFTIEQATATINAIVNDVAYPDCATVDLSATQDGDYTIEVFDSEGNLVDNKSGSLVANETITVELDLLDVGNYTVIVTYENDNYTAKPVIDNLTIEKGEPIIDINVGETTFPEKAVLNITSSADGNFTVYIDGEIFANGTFTAGEPVFITAGLLSADYYHEVCVTYDGNENYDPTTEYYIFTINQGAPVIYLYVDYKEILENSTLYILIPYGNGNITVNGKSMELNYSENFHFGFAKYNIGILKAETYDLTVIYYGNENLTSGDNFTSFTVNKLPSNLTVIVENTTYGVDPHAFITIDNIDEINLDLYVDGEYAKTIKVVNGTSDGYLADLNAGEHNFTVAYAGSDVYEAETVTADFTIGKADVNITLVGYEYTYPGDIVVTVMADVEGLYEVSIGLQSQYVPLEAYEAVDVSFSGFGAGNHTVWVERPGDINYNYAVEWLDVVVEKGDVTMTIVPVSDIVDYPDDVVVTVTSDVAGSYLIFADPDTEPKNITLEANKPVNVSFYKLGVGLHNMAIVYLGSDNYESDIELANVTVIKAPVEIEIFAPDVAYPNPVIVTVTVNVDGLFNVTVGEITKPVYLYANTPTDVGFNNLSGGWYDIIVSCPETEKYNATTETSYVIVHRNVNIEVSAPDVDFPEDVVVTVTADVTGTYTVKVGSVSYDVDLEANVAKNVTFKDLNAGTYDVTVTYPETEVYDETIVTTSVTVNKGTPEILLVVDTTTILENANLTIVIPYATGNVVLVNGKPVVLVDGLATYNIGTLKAETYDFTVVYSGDDNLNFGTVSDSFTVEKLASNLDVFVDNSTYGVPAFSYISLNNTDYVTVQLWLDDEFINFVNIIGGRQTKYVTDVAAGEHTIKVVYDGSDVYNADEKSYNFTIAKAEVTITVDAANVTYPEDVVVSVMSDVAGTYGVTIGDTTKSVVLEANVAKNVTFAGLAAGTHEIAAFFTGNENYTSSVEYADAIVNKVENTPVYIYATSPIASENATIYVYVPTDATGNVTVKYGNGVYTAEIVDGEAVVSVPTSTIPGTDNASVSYSGDDNYEGATDEVEVTVLPNGYVIAENIRRGVNSPYDYYATLVDLEGNPIAGVELTFTILGQTFKATTNASGIATVSAGLSVVNGSDTVYDITVTNPYSFKNVTATTTIVPRLIVCSGDLTADYLTNPAYVVQAIGDDGNPVGAGVVVRIVFAGFYYDLETNATGHVKRTIGLAPGMYAVRGEYMGYITNQTVFVVKQVMKVTSGTLKKTAKSYTLKATLKSSDGIAIAGETVKLTFNGKTYTVKTNSKGVASYTIKSSVISKLKAGQTYELKAKYENDIVKGKIKVVSK